MSLENRVQKLEAIQKRFGDLSFYVKEVKVFVESVFQENRSLFGPRRKDGERKLNECVLLGA